MENRKRTWNWLLILAHVALGIAWILLGRSDHKTSAIILGVCWLGLAFGRTWLTLRDLKNLPENPVGGSDWTGLPENPLDGSDWSNLP